jgi:hypothetical protein
MVVCFHCSTETKEMLDRLVQSAGYGDQDAVVEAAVRKLVQAHGETPRNIPARTDAPALHGESQVEMNWEGIC